jgi:hypothetical protein
MAANKRTPFQREHDLGRLAELYLRGHTQHEMARELGICRQQVGYDLKEVQKRWRESALGDINTKKEQELARIDHLERVYWQAWEESKKLRETTTSTTEKTMGQAESPSQQGPVRLKAAMRKQERDGNPEFLRGIQWCINKRCEILGLHAPTTSVQLGRDEPPPYKVYMGFDPNKDI